VVLELPKPCLFRVKYGDNGRGSWELLLTFSAARSAALRRSVVAFPEVWRLRRGRSSPAGQQQVLKCHPALQVLVDMLSLCRVDPCKSVCTPCCCMDAGRMELLRSIERAFFYMHTGKQYVYRNYHEHLGQTARFQTGSIISISLYAFSFYLRYSACWAGKSISLQINFNLK